MKKYRTGRKTEKAIAFADKCKKRGETLSMLSKEGEEADIIAENLKLKKQVADLLK